MSNRTCLLAFRTLVAGAIAASAMITCCPSAHAELVRVSKTIDLGDYRITPLPGWKPKLFRSKNFQEFKFLRWSGQIFLDAIYMKSVPCMAARHHDLTTQESNNGELDGTAKAMRIARENGDSTRMVERKAGKLLNCPAWIERVEYRTKLNKFPYSVSKHYALCKKSGFYFFALTAASTKPDGLDAALDKEWPAFVRSISLANDR